MMNFNVYYSSSSAKTAQAPHKHNDESCARIVSKQFSVRTIRRYVLAVFAAIFSPGEKIVQWWTSMYITVHHQQKRHKPHINITTNRAQELFLNNSLCARFVVLCNSFAIFFSQEKNSAMMNFNVYYSSSSARQKPHKHNDESCARIVSKQFSVRTIRRYVLCRFAAIFSPGEKIVQWWTSMYITVHHQQKRHKPHINITTNRAQELFLNNSVRTIRRYSCRFAAIFLQEKK